MTSQLILVAILFHQAQAKKHSYHCHFTVFEILNR
uniref:Uncharacterized protein n=1 Tax=Arundo donax TaxID=35708 RepID=A0A0A9AZN3_ARUDO